MAKFERVEDKWKDLRKDLYGNVEPTVELEAVTMPVFMVDRPAHYEIQGNGGISFEDIVDWKKIEELPAIAAGVSYGSKDTMENDHERAIKLNKKLIEMGHHTPLEAIQLNLYITGISKACGAQISRYRVGNGHVSASRRFQEAEPKFIYPVLDYIDNEEYARYILFRMRDSYRDSMRTYEAMREGSIIYIEELEPEGLRTHKEDARMVLPVSYATERSWWVNIRSLRHIFDERLRADAENEIRRLAWMIWDLIEPLFPSLFFDIKKEIELSSEK